MAEQDAVSRFHVFKELYDNELFSDLTVKCPGGREFKLHKNILYARSKVFRALLEGPFKEATASVIELPEDARVLEVLFRTIYLASEDWDPPSDGYSKTCFAILIYAVADKYDVPSLRDAAARRFSMTCWADDTEDLIAAIRLINENTAEPTLMTIVLGKVTHSIEELLKIPSFMDLLAELPHFNADLLKRMAADKRNKYVKIVRDAVVSAKLTDLRRQQEMARRG